MEQNYKELLEIEYIMFQMNVLFTRATRKAAHNIAISNYTRIACHQTNLTKIKSSESGQRYRNDISQLSQIQHSNNKYTYLGLSSLGNEATKLDFNK